MFRMLRRSVGQHWLKGVLLAMVLGVGTGLWFALAQSAQASEQSLNACVTPPANLASWWRLEGNFQDQLGLSNGSVVGSVSATPGKVGTATLFAASGYGSVPSNASTNVGTGDFTMAGWIRTTSTADYAFMFDKRQSAGVNGYQLLLYQGHVLVQLSTSSFSNFWTPSSPTYNNGVWHYVVASIDRDSAAGLNVYVDGQLVSTYDPRGRSATMDNSAALIIGAHTDGNYKLDGALDELDIYKRALSASEVQALYAAGSAGKCTTPATPTPTNTAVPATATNTAVPATNTPTAVPPTATNTAVPATNTPTATTPASPTPVTPTATNPPNQSFRDIGPIRIWADGFVDSNGTTATGNVAVGSAATNQRFFGISGSATWQPGGPLTLDGTLTIYSGAKALGLGSFTVNTGTGAVTWAPTNQVLYRKIGSSELQITPIITVNVLQPEVSVQALVVLALPEQQELRSNVSFKLGPQGAISASTATTFNLKMGGGTLTGSIMAGTAGLTADNVQYALPGVGTVTLQSLVIDGKGPAKFHFGGSTTFPVPDLNLGNNVLVLTNLQATLGLTVTNQSAPNVSYMLALSGTLKLTNLPQNGNVSIDAFNLSIADGVIAGRVQNLDLTIAGKNLKLAQAEFKQKVFGARDVQTIKYELVADWASWDLPSAWSGPLAAKVALRNVVIQTDAPYLTIGGAGADFSTPNPFYLGGNANSNASVRFDQLQGSFRYNLDTKTWTAELNVRVMFTFGQDSAAFSGVVIKINNGQATAKLTNAQFKLAGLELTASTLDYSDTAFTASSISLKLPVAWGNNSVTVSDLRITSDGVRIGGAAGSFAIPDQSLGDVLKLKSLSASVQIDAQRNYSITINATIEINKVTNSSGGNNASVSGSLTIANGRVSGTISQLSFKLVGLEFSASQVQFIDNHLTAQTVTLTLPSALGSARTTVYGLEIGGSAGFRMQGGSFRLPDFTMAGMGVQNAQAEFNRESDGTYIIGAGAKLNLQTFSIEAHFRIAYNSSTHAVGLRHVYLAFEGTIPSTAIPLGNTGFFLTKVWGSFDMDTNTLKMEFGVRASMALQVAGKGLLDLQGSVAIQIRPSFDFRSSASASLLGYNLATVNLHINRNIFELDAQLHAGIIHATLEIAFGRDVANEFTFYGAVRIDLMIPRGTFVNKRWLKVPRNDWKIGNMMLDGGKFTHNGQKVWGARVSSHILFIDFFVFAKFSPGLGIDVGTRMSEYQPIRPAGRSPLATLRPTDDLYEVNVTASTTQLTLIEGITTTNQLAPAEITVVAPNGAQFVKTLAYTEPDGSYRIYTLAIADPAQATGTWTLITQPGNELAIFGAIPAPKVDSFSACVAVALCLADSSAAPLPLELGQSLDLAWQTSHVTPGLALEVYAEDAAGTRYAIAAQETDTAAALVSDTTWTPILPAGTYTVTLHIEDRMSGATTVQKQAIQLLDTSAPAAPVGLQAFAFEDGSVHVVWNGAAMAPDVIGYQVVVDGLAPQMIEERTGSHTVYGLELGTAHAIAVSLYDMSGNLGPASTAQVTLSQLGVASTWPPRDLHSTMVGNVQIVFNRSVVVDSFTVSTADGSVVGSFAPLTSETAPGVFAQIGAIFTPTSGRLPVGAYSTIVQAHDAETGATVTVEWPFEVVAPAIKLFLPTVKR